MFVIFGFRTKVYPLGWVAMACHVCGVPGDMFLVYALCSEVDLCHGLGEPARAQALYDQLLPWSGRLANGGSGALSEGAVDHFLGLAADLLGDRATAERHLRAALALHEAIPAPLHVARTRAALTALG